MKYKTNFYLGKGPRVIKRDEIKQYIDRNLFVYKHSYFIKYNKFRLSFMISNSNSVYNSLVRQRISVVYANDNAM